MMREAAVAASDRLQDWLSAAAAPLWFGAGLDRAGRAFVESIALDGTPGREPTRTLVQARQIYSAVELGRLGAAPAWREAVDIGLERLFGPARRSDGAFVFRTTLAGAVDDARIDLYTQAFVLFALAHAFAALDRPRQLKAAAAALLDWLDAHLSHPAGGYGEARPAVAPLRSNPHMHLFEAALAWMAVDDDPRWSGLADRLARLARLRFIDAGSGTLLEYFDLDWAPVPGPQGAIVEPGHQFEWAWLLTRWAECTGQDQEALIGPLYRFATEKGLCPNRGSAYLSVDPAGTPIDPVSRLWPQTERIKAAVTRPEPDWAAAAAAHTALERFLAAPVRGLWRDRLRPDGSWIDQPSPASSLYHIVCAAAELKRALTPP